MIYSERSQGMWQWQSREYSVRTREMPNLSTRSKRSQASLISRDFNMWVLTLITRTWSKLYGVHLYLISQKLPKETSQIFTITQGRSWTTLNISRELFEGFMSTYKIMPSFWKYMFTFGRKSEENEFEFPRFGQRRTRDIGSKSSTQGSSRQLSLHRCNFFRSNEN